MQTGDHRVRGGKERETERDIEREFERDSEKVQYQQRPSSLPKSKLD